MNDDEQHRYRDAGHVWLLHWIVGSDLHGEFPGGLQDERSERRAPVLLALAASLCMPDIGCIIGQRLAVQQLQDGQAKGESLA